MVVHGFFGKLPGEGDFVDRGWRPGSRDALDRLLQEALSQLDESIAPAKDLLADAPDIALSSRPGVVGDDGLVLLVVPSRDRVGRAFPLCAGVQWREEAGASAGWPSPDYARAVGRCVRGAMGRGADADALLGDLMALGVPWDYAPAFAAAGGDETVPRVGAETVLLRIAAAPSELGAPMAALCGVLAESSAVLGLRIDATGDGGVRDLFVCRRLASPADLAALFDGQWSTHGWSCFDALGPAAEVNPKDVLQIDEDATRPLPGIN